MLQLRGYHRGIEFKARTEQSYASGYTPYSYSTMPSGARRYKDTQQTDPGCCTYGYGAGNANYLSANILYTNRVEVQKPWSSPHSYFVDWDVNAMTLEDHQLPNCTGNETFCNFADYTQRLVRTGSFAVTQAQTKTVGFWQNALSNQSFEEGYNYYGIGGPGPSAIYCGNVGWNSNCFLEYNNAGAGSAISVYQDVQMNIPGGVELSAEAAVRCPQWQASCPLTLAIWGLGNSPYEARSIGVTLPADGQWYICRVDEEHGFAEPFVHGHSTVRWEIYNNGWGQNLDVDYATLGLWTDRIDGTVGDQLPAPAHEPPCVPDWHHNGYP